MDMSLTVRLERCGNIPDQSCGIEILAKTAVRSFIGQVVLEPGVSYGQCTGHVHM